MTNLHNLGFWSVDIRNQFVVEFHKRIKWLGVTLQTQEVSTVKLENYFQRRTLNQEYKDLLVNGFLIGISN